jgi:ribonuclease HI
MSATHRPSPGLMPKQRNVTKPQRAHLYATPTLTITVANGYRQFDRARSLIVQASMGHHISPVIQGPVYPTLRRIADWTARHMPDSRPTLTVRIHTATVGDRPARRQHRICQAFDEACLDVTECTTFAYLDVATAAGVRSVAAGQTAPDLLTLRHWTGPLPYRAVGAPDPGADDAEQNYYAHRPLNARPGRRRRIDRFVRQLRTASNRWCHPDHPLLVSAVPTGEQLGRLPDVLEVYSDASCGASDRTAGFGLVCPALGIVATGVLDPAMARSVDSATAETAAIGAAVTLFTGLTDKLVVRTDSTAAMNWWPAPDQMPQRRSRVREAVMMTRGRERGQHAEVQWVKGHHDCGANLWADRAARLSWRCMDWAESESCRATKFTNLVADFVDNPEDAAALAGEQGTPLFLAA